MPISDPTITSTFGTGTAVTITMPASNTDDALIAAVQFRGGTSTTITPPTGWALTNRQDYLTETSLAVYERIATASEPTDYTWTLGASVQWIGGIAAYGGAGLPEVNIGRADQYGVRNYSTEPITTISANNRVVAIATQQSPTIYTAPSGWVVQGQNRSGANVRSDVSLSVIDITQASAGLVAAATIDAAVGASALLIADQDGVISSNNQSVELNASCLRLGMGVTILADTNDGALLTAAAEAADVTVILGEVAHTVLGNKLTAADVGVMDAQRTTWDNFELVSSHRVVNNDQLTVTNPSHPVSDDVTGTFNLYGASGGSIAQVNLTGSVATGVEFVIRRGDGTGDPSSFAVEKGGTLLDLTAAPGRRVGFCGDERNGGGDWQQLTRDLADAAIDYSVRYGVSPQLIVMLALPESGGGGGITGSGNANIPVPSIIGTGQLSRLGSGNIGVPIITVSGVGSLSRLGSGNFTIPLPGILGIGATGGKVGTGDIATPIVTISGTGNLSRTGIGNIDIPLVTISGIGRLSRLGLGNITIPIPSIAGAGSKEAVLGAGGISIPIVQILGLGTITRRGDGNVTTPMVQVTGIGAVTRTKTATGNITTPVIAIAGVGTRQLTAIGTGNLAITMVTIQGVGTVGSIVIPSDRTVVLDSENRTVILDSENRTVNL